MQEPQAGNSALGLGKRIKVLEVGEIEQVRTERHKFREGPGITIAHVKHQVLDSIFCIVMFVNGLHFYKLTKENP